MSKQLGKKLKSLRKESGLSFESLSKKTKIPVKYLRFLEKEQFENLPQPVFVKGFLKKWAIATDGDSSELEKIYKKHSHSSISSKLSDIHLARPIHLAKKADFKKALIGLSMLVLVSIPSYFIYDQFINIKSPTIEIISPTEVNSISLERDVNLEGKTKGVKRLTINGQEVALETNGTFNTSYQLEDGLNVISFEVVDESGKEVEIIRKIVYGS